MPDLEADWTSSNAYQIHQFEIEVEYTFNLKELYKRLHFYFEDEEWTDLFGMQNYEVRYWQRDKPDGLQEHHIWWRMYKIPGNQNLKNDFFKYFIKLDYQTLATKRVEHMHKGKKWNIYKSNTILRVEGHLIINWDGWNKGLLGGMKGAFNQWLYKDKIKWHEDQLYMEVGRLYNVIKDFLELTKDAELEPNIYPPNMLP